MAGYNMKLEPDYGYHETIFRIKISAQEIAIITESLNSFTVTLQFRSKAFILNYFKPSSFVTEFDRWNAIITRRTLLEKITEEGPTAPEQYFWAFMVKHYDPCEIEQN